MKKNNKLTIKISFLILFLFSIFTSITTVTIYPNIYASINSISSSKTEKWIRQRSFSFIGYNNSFNRIFNTSFFGTIWVSKKVSSDENNFKYYLATNMHIVSKVLKLKNDAKQGSNNQNDYIIDSNWSIKLAIPKYPDKILPSSFRDYNNDLFSTKIDTNDIKIIKLGFFENRFDYEANKKINYGIKDDELSNYFQLPLIDLAILEFNFNNYLNIKQWLKKHYDPNPTSFYYSNSNWENAKNNNIKIKENSIYVGGYPFLQKKETIEFQSKKSEINLISDGSESINDIDSLNVYKFTLNLSNKNIYQNVARNLKLQNVSFDGGSSGSIAFVYNKEEDKFKAIGIFWGTYGNDRHSLVDLFYSSSYIPFNGKGVFPGYNFLAYLS